MQGAPTVGTAYKLPPEFRAVPIHPADEHVPLRLCVLVRASSDPVAGRFFQLRDMAAARVYLACVCDAGGRVREWIELWVQTVQGINPGLASHREAFTNHLLDQRWATQCDAMRAWSPESFIETNWERRHPLPSLIDLSTFSVIHPKGGESGGNWELCQDDALLEGAELPPYRTSLARYLYQPGEGHAARFVPVAGDAAENAATLSPTKALGLSERVIPFNSQAGLMMATAFHPFGYEEYVDLLGGKSWTGLAHGTTQFQLGEAYQSLTDWNQQQNSGAYLFFGAQGRTGRLVETLHLKLQLLADVFRTTRVCVRAHQLPFLNLSPESFRVKLAEISTSLPFLWTAKCAVVQPPQALAIQVKTTEKRLFVRIGPSAGSIYLPEGQVSGGLGLGTVRVRKVLPHEQNSLIIEGTLVMQEPVRCSPRDILWLRLPLGAGQVDLYGHIDSDSLAFSEMRFRTMPQQLPESAALALRSGGVVVFPRCQYEIIPLLSSPCDLYSLAVVAIRTLLVNDKAALPAALDDLLSLARQAALEHKPGAALPTRIAAIFAQKAAWLESLGPQRLLAEALSPAEAITLVPAELWYEVLAAIVRLFPGTGPDSYCADLGDAPPLALETVFDRPVADLEDLLLKTRSLIVIDWNFNREIRAAIEEFRTR